MPTCVQSRSRSGAFTLIEVLVVIGVIGVLVAILIPMLGAVRRAGRESVSLSNVRSLTQLMLAYTQDYRDAWPFLRAGKGVNVGQGVLLSSENHWAQSQLWPGIVMELVSIEPPAILQSPGAAQSSEPKLLTSYSYSLSFVARPELWTAGTTPAVASLDATRVAEVRFPSRKVLLHDSQLFYNSRPLPRRGVDLAIACPASHADGSATLSTQAEGTPAVPNPLNGNGLFDGQRWHNTATGVLGFDEP